MEKQRVLKNFLKYWSPLSVNTYEGVPYCETQLFKNIVPICIELILALVIARVNLEKLSIIITSCLFLVVVRNTTLKILMATNPNGLEAGKS